MTKEDDIRKGMDITQWVDEARKDAIPIIQDEVSRKFDAAAYQALRGRLPEMSEKAVKAGHAGKKLSELIKTEPFRSIARGAALGAHIPYMALFEKMLNESTTDDGISTSKIILIIRSPGGYADSAWGILKSFFESLNKPKIKTKGKPSTKRLQRLKQKRRRHRARKGSVK